MIHSIYTNLFTHQNQVSYNDEIHYSYCNHNYYTSEEGEIILEECDGDNSFDYWQIDPITGETDFIGGTIATFGIFDEHYDGYYCKDNNVIVELDTDFYKKLNNWF